MVDVQAIKRELEQALEASRRDEGFALGMVAFRYGYPAVEMLRSLREWHYDKSSASYLGPINTVHHTTRRAEPRDTYFVTPLVDAPYSRTFIDLEYGPMLLSIPTIDDRYFTVQLLDMYTNAFAYVGTSHDDVSASRFLIVGPGWRDEVPGGITRVITAPTPTICLLARVAIIGDDVDAAVALQTQINIEPLDPTTPAPAEPPPYEDFHDSDPLAFFRTLALVLSDYPPPARDAGVLGLLERIGIALHRRFDPSTLHPKAIEGMKRAIPASITSLYGEMPAISPVRNGWILPTVDRVGDFGTDYYLRLEIAQIGLLANVAHEAYYVGAVVDGDGEPLVGDNTYVMHFARDELPDVDAFWSLTMYLNPEGFLVENPAKRYHLGSLTNLTYNDDGSLDIYIQRESPGAEKESNWLPCTEPGKLFRVILRQYRPRAKILSGHYAPPPIVRV